MGHNILIILTTGTLMTTVKIIVYSTIETILYIDMANLWSDNSWTPGIPDVVGHTVRVKEGIVMARGSEYYLCQSL